MAAECEETFCEGANPEKSAALAEHAARRHVSSAQVQLPMTMVQTD